MSELPDVGGNERCDLGGIKHCDAVVTLERLKQNIYTLNYILMKINIEK